MWKLSRHADTRVSRRLRHILSFRNQTQKKQVAHGFFFWNFRTELEDQWRPASNSNAKVENSRWVLRVGKKTSRRGSSVPSRELSRTLCDRDLNRTWKRTVVTVERRRNSVGRRWSYLRAVDRGTRRRRTIPSDFAQVCGSRRLLGRPKCVWFETHLVAGTFLTTPHHLWESRPRVRVLERAREDSPDARTSKRPKGARRERERERDWSRDEWSGPRAISRACKWNAT